LRDFRRSIDVSHDRNLRKKLLTVAVGDPLILDAFVATRLSLRPALATALIAQGAVHVDGARATDATRSLMPGSRVIVYLASDVPGSGPTFAITYEDDWLIVVDKPAGMPSQPTRGESATALDARVIARFPDARMMHRLDRDASGLVLFARSPAARAPLQHALEGGKIERHYRAVVSGRLEGAGTIDFRIGRDPRDERRRIAHPASSTAGQPASSHWRALAAGTSSTALALELDTGRTHQLRVHLSAIGHPILGDRLYGGANAERLHLHATRLRLPHPRDEHIVEVVSVPPFSVDAPP
jgi:RluA family pseudouridine synthase